MTALSIILIVIAALIVLWIALCFVLLCGTLMRVKMPETEPESLKRLRKHGDFIRDGVRWLLEREPEEVEITSFDGLKLRALYLPAENARCTAILMHGYRSEQLWDFAGAYELLHTHGCNLLVPWQRAHGRSEGRFICMGKKEKRDCADWARYIENRLGSDMPIVLEGMSMGAATVMMAAGEPLPENVRGIVADCGYSSVWEEMAHVMRARMHLAVHPLLDCVELLCRLVLGFGFKDGTTDEILRGSTLPLLLIHGEADNFVPAHFSRTNFAASASPDKTLILVPEAGHGMSYLTDTERCRDAVLSFYDRVTGSADGLSDGNM